MALNDCIAKFEKAGAPISGDQIAALEGFLKLGMTDEQAVRAVALQSHQNVVDIAHRVKNEGGTLAPVSDPVTSAAQFQAKALQKIADKQEALKAETTELTDKIADSGTVINMFRSMKPAQAETMTEVVNNISDDTVLMDLIMQFMFDRHFVAVNALGLKGRDQFELFDSFRALEVERDAMKDRLVEVVKEEERLTEQVEVIFHGKGQTFYQSAGPPKLMVRHNIAADQLIFADEFGGLALPSLAVTKEGADMSGFGEVTLIGTQDLGDPGKVPIFDADGYTVRMPPPDYKPAPAADRDALVRDVMPYVVRFEGPQSNLTYYINQHLNETPNPQGMVWQLLDSNAVKAWYLEEVWAMDLKPKMMDVQSTYDWGWNDEVVEFFAGDHPELNLQWEDPRRQALLVDAGEMIERNSKQAIAKRLRLDVGHEKVQSLWALQGMRNRDGAISERLFEELKRNAARKGTSTVDYTATTEMMDEGLKQAGMMDALLGAGFGLEGPSLHSYRQWVENKVNSMMGEPRIKVGGKWQPYNLENVVRKMKGKLRGAEAAGFSGDMTEGLMRALVAHRFKRIEEMRARSEVAMEESDEVDALRAVAQAEMNLFIGQIGQFYEHLDAHGYVDSLEAGDSVRRAIIRWATRPRATATALDLHEELIRQGFSDDAPDWLIDEGMQAAMTWLAVPVPYFEAKPQRAVMLDEFAGAVIPMDAKPEVRAVLRKHGITFKEYQVGQTIDEKQTRTDAITELTQALNDAGERTLFQSEIGFTSGLLTAAQTMPRDKGSAQDMINTLKKQPNVKKQELEWLGVDEWAEAKGTITREELIEFIEVGGVQLREVQYGGTIKKLPVFSFSINENMTEDQRQADGGDGLIWDVSDDNNDFYFTVYEDRDAGNVSVLLEDEVTWLEVDAAMADGTQTLDDAKNAMEDYIVEQQKDPRYKDTPRWKEYVLDGGTNQREVVLHMPEMGGGKYAIEDMVQSDYMSIAQPSESQREIEEQDKKFWHIDAKGAVFNEKDKARKVDTFRLPKADFPTVEDAMQHIATEKRQQVSGDNEVIAHTSHSYPQPNIIAWFRVNDRIGPNGERIFFVEEVQSELHQEGQQRGYKLSRAERKKLNKKAFDASTPAIRALRALNDLGFDTSQEAMENVLAHSDWKRRWSVYDNIHLDEIAAIDKWRELRLDTERAYHGVVNLPFKDDAWASLAMKRIIRLAAEGGYDQIMWTTGDQQNERWNLSDHFDRIEWDPRDEMLTAYDMDGQLLITEHSALEDLGQYNINSEQRMELQKQVDAAMTRFDMEFAGEVLDIEDSFVPKRFRVQEKLDNAYVLIDPNGEIMRDSGGSYLMYDSDEAAQEAINDVAYSGNIPTLQNMDLDPGTGGMNTFYDKVLVNVMNKAARKLDKKAKVKRFGGQIPVSETSDSPWSGDKYLTEDLATVHSIDVTADMMTMALEGMTLFQDKNRASITFDDTNKAIIRMSQSKDLSSFMHEMAHLYLEMMGDLAEADGASDRIINDYAKVLTYLGVNSRREIGRDQHELLARSWEAYLREGNAPTAELQPIFTEVKGWMIRIYRQLDRLLGPDEQLTDEIRGVFDRMMATDAQIKASEDYMGYVALFASAEDMGITQRAFEVYRSLFNESHDEAVDHETKKMLKAMLWGQQQWWKDELKKVEAEVRAEAEQMPVYKALAFLQKGKRPDGTEPPIAPFKLSKESVMRIAKGSQSFINRLPRPYIYRVKGGVDADVAATMFGYGSGTEMIHAILQSSNMEDYIRDEGRRRMDERHPDPLNSPEQADEATRAVHNDKRSRILAAELRAARKKIKEDAKIVSATKKDLKEQDKLAREANKGQMPTREDMAHIRAAAAKVIAGKRIRDVTPNTYLQAERKHGRLAFEAMGRKDYAEAYRQKLMQIRNYEAYRAAVKAKAQAARDQKYLKGFEKKAKRQKMGKAGVLEQIDAILEGINFRKISGAKIDRENLNAEMLPVIKAAIADGTLVVPPEVLKSLETPGGVNWQEMTFEEFAGVRDLVKQLEHKAKTQLEIIINGEKVVIQEAVDQVANSIVENHDVVVIPRGEGGVGRQAKKSVKEGIGHWLRTSSIGRILDDSGFGAVTQRIIVPIRRAYTEKLYPRIQQMTEDLAGIYKRHYSNKELSQLAKPIEDLTKEKMSKSDILALALNWGSESNRDAVLGGIMEDAQGNKSPAFTEEEVAGLLARLDARDWAFVQDMWRYQDTYYPEMAETERRRRGIAPEKVEGLTFEVTTSDGQTITVEGGYHPLQYNPEHGGQVSEKEFEDYFNRVTNGTYVSANTRAGATYERVKNHGKVVLLSLNTIDRNLREVIRDITLGDEVNLVRRILTSKEVTNAGRNTGNQALIKELTLWLSDAAVGELPAQSAWEKGLSWVRVGFTKSKLAFNIYVTMLQLTGVFQSMAVIGSMTYARGVGMFITNPAGNYKSVMEESAFMQARYGILQTWDKDVQDTNNFLQSMFGPAPTKFKGAVDTMGHYYFYTIAKAQSVVDVTTWMGAKEKGMNELGYSEEKAVLYADSQVEAAQTSGLFSDRSGIERGTLGSRTRQSQFVRLWTTLISYMLAKLNLAYEKGVGFKKRPTVMNAVELATDYILLFMVEGIASSILYDNWPGDEDEDESVGGWVAKVTIDSMLSGIPLVREYSAAKYGSGNTPIGALFMDTYKFIQQTKQGDVDEAMVKSGIKVAGTLFHLPASQVNRAVEAAMSDDDSELYEYFTGKRD